VELLKEGNMEVELAVAPSLTTPADRPSAEPAMRAAAVRVIARTRVAWSAPAPDVSARRTGRPTMELNASRALDNQPWTGD
jgi:hypothetical protein